MGQLGRFEREKGKGKREKEKGVGGFFGAHLMELMIERVSDHPREEVN